MSTRKIFKNLHFAKISTGEIRFFFLARQKKFTQKLARLRYTKWSIIYSRTLRVKRTCSEEEDFEQHIHAMRRIVSEKNLT